MIELVSLAENYLAKNSTVANTLADGSLQEMNANEPQSIRVAPDSFPGKEELLKLACIRRKVSEIRGSAMLAQLNYSTEACTFANLTNVKEVASRGPITSIT